MTRQLHARRGLVLALSTALFAATATGSALAWGGTVEQVAVRTPVPAVSTTPSAAVPAAVPAAAPATAAPQAVTHSAAAAVRATATTKAATARATAAAKATAKATAKARPTTGTTASSSSSAATVYRITSYVDAPGSQAQIDSCHLVLWTHSPLWLAGHNWCGYQWMAFVPVGAKVVVTRGAAAGTYVVTGHIRLGRQSGSLPSVRADLVLQTCVGSSTGLSLLRRV